MTTPKFAETSCSQCGQSFGPGDHGFSHCDDHRAGVRKAHSDLISRLAALKPHAIPTFPDPDDFAQRAAHMRDIAIAVDTYILALGRDCAENVRGSFDLALFTAQVSNALDGNALYELECCAEEIEDEMADERVAW